MCAVEQIHHEQDVHICVGLARQVALSVAVHQAQVGRVQLIEYRQRPQRADLSMQAPVSASFWRG